MGVFVRLLRLVVGFVLALFVLAGFAYFIGAGAVKTAVLDPSILLNSLDEYDAYDLTYQGVLLSGDLDDVTDGLLGGFRLSDDDAEILLREVVPPDDIRTAVVQGIESIAAYFNNESDDLNVSIDLSARIDGIPSAVQALVAERISELEAGSRWDTGDTVEQMESFLRTAVRGRLPTRLPAIHEIPASARAEVYTDALAAFGESASIPSDILAALEERESEIVAALGEGSGVRGLSLAIEVAAGPRISNAVEELREELDDAGRLDLLHRGAVETDLTREELMDDLDAGRLAVRFALNVGPWIAVAVMALSIIFTSLIFIPHRKHMFMWPGITLLLVGMMFLFVGWVLTLDVTGALRAQCGLDDVGCRFGVGLARDTAWAVGSGIIPPSAAVVALGLAGIVASILIPSRRSE